MTSDDQLPTRRFGWWDIFVDEDHDPRTDGGWDNDERSIVVGFLDDRRLTLELKCQGLDAEPPDIAQLYAPESSLVEGIAVLRSFHEGRLSDISRVRLTMCPIPTGPSAPTLTGVVARVPRSDG